MYYPAQIVFHADSDICVISDALPTRHCLHKSIMSYQINSEKCHSRKLIYYGFTSYYYLFNFRSENAWSWNLPFGVLILQFSYLIRFSLKQFFLTRKRLDFFLAFDWF